MLIDVSSGEKIGKQRLVIFFTNGYSRPREFHRILSTLFRGVMPQRGGPCDSNLLNANDLPTLGIEGRLVVNFTFIWKG